MRPHERQVIDHFLKHFNLNKYKRKFTAVIPMTPESFNYFVHQWKTYYPDESFHQALGLMNRFKDSYSSTAVRYRHMSNSEVLVKLGVPVDEAILWANWYNKDGTKRRQPKMIPMKDTNTFHIRRLLDISMYRLNDFYRHAFEYEIRRRQAEALKQTSII